MEFLFMALTLGCLGFLVKIVMDYMREVPDWSGRWRMIEAEKAQHEAGVSALADAKAGAEAEAQAISEEIKTLEGHRDELRKEIEKKKKEMARKGKIIINRNAGS